MAGAIRDQGFDPFEAGRRERAREHRRIVNMADTLGEGGILQDVALGLGRFGSNIVSTAGHILPISGASDAANRINRQSSEIEQAARLRDEQQGREWGSALRGAVSTIPEMALAMEIGGGLAARAPGLSGAIGSARAPVGIRGITGPLAATRAAATPVLRGAAAVAAGERRIQYAAILTAAGANVASSSYTEAIDAGHPNPRMHALSQGALEVGVTMAMNRMVGMGLEGLMTRQVISRAATTGIRRAMATAGASLRAIGPELMEENVVEFSQALGAALDGVDPGALDADRLAALFEETTKTTLLTVGIHGGARVGADAVTDFRDVRQANVALTQLLSEREARRAEPLADVAARVDPQNIEEAAVAIQEARGRRVQRAHRDVESRTAVATSHREDFSEMLADANRPMLRAMHRAATGRRGTFMTDSRLRSSLSRRMDREQNPGFFRRVRNAVLDFTSAPERLATAQQEVAAEPAPENVAQRAAEVIAPIRDILEQSYDRETVGRDFDDIETAVTNMVHAGTNPEAIRAVLSFAWRRGKTNPVDDVRTLTLRQINNIIRDTKTGLGETVTVTEVRNAIDAFDLRLGPSEVSVGDFQATKGPRARLTPLPSRRTTAESYLDASVERRRQGDSAGEADLLTQWAVVDLWRRAKGKGDTKTLNERQVSNARRELTRWEIDREGLAFPTKAEEKRYTTPLWPAAWGNVRMAPGIPTDNHLFTVERTEDGWTITRENLEAVDAARVTDFATPPPTGDAGAAVAAEAAPGPAPAAAQAEDAPTTEVLEEEWKRGLRVQLAEGRPLVLTPAAAIERQAGQVSQRAVAEVVQARPRPAYRHMTEEEGRALWEEHREASERMAGRAARKANLPTQAVFDIEDIASNAMVSALRTFDPAGGAEFRTHLFSHVKGQVTVVQKAHARRGGTVPVESIPEPAAVQRAPVEFIMEDERRAALDSVYANMTGDQQDALRMKGEEGMSIPAIARSLGTEMPETRRIIKQATAIAKRNLGDDFEVKYFGAKHNPVMKVNMESAPADEGPPVNPNDIKDAIGKLFGVRQARAGRHPKGEGSHYNKFTQTIHATGRNEVILAVRTHELGHHIWNTSVDLDSMPNDVKLELIDLDYTEALDIQEGFAEFVRLYATGTDYTVAPAKRTNPLIAKAPNTLAWWNDVVSANQKVGDNLNRITEMIGQWQIKSPLGRGLAGQAHIGSTPKNFAQTNYERFTGYVRKTWRRFYQHKVDDLLGLEKFHESVQKYASVHRKLGANHALRAVTDGVFDLITGKKIGPALTDVYEAGSIEQGEDQAMFNVYAEARQTIEIHAKKPEMETNMLIDDATTIVNEAPARYDEALIKMVEFSDAMLEMMFLAGTQTQESVDRMRAAWSVYVPLSRILDDSVMPRPSSQGLQDALPQNMKRRFGSTKTVVAPMEQLIANTVASYEAAIKQQLGTMMADFSDKNPHLELIRRLDPEIQKNAVQTAADVEAGISEPGLIERGFILNETAELEEQIIGMYSPLQFKGDNTTLTIRRNGVPVLYKIEDVEVYLTLEALDHNHAGAALQLASDINHYLKLGATGLNPAFIVGNIVRDAYAAAIQREYASLVKGGIDAGKLGAVYLAHKAGIVEDPLIKYFIEMGGEMSSIMGSDPKSIKHVTQEMLDVASGRPNRTAFNRNALKFVWDKGLGGLENTTFASDAAPRLSEFKAALVSNGGMDAILKGERASMDQLTEAMYAAKDVTINFQRAGIDGRKINMAIAFFNPTVQGVDKMARTVKKSFTDPKTRRRLVVTLGITAAATLALALANRDEDKYEELTLAEKLKFWHFYRDGERYLRIPRPHEWGVLAQLIDIMINGDKFKESGLEVAGRVAMSVVPPVTPALTPVAEAAFNYDTFRESEIANDRVLPADQSNYRTMSPFKWLGKQLGMSPARLQHVADESLGGMLTRISNMGGRTIGTAVQSLFDSSVEVESSDPLGVMFNTIIPRRDHYRSYGEMKARHKREEQVVASANLHGTATAEQWAQSRHTQECLTFVYGMYKLIHGDDTTPEIADDAALEMEHLIVGLSRYSNGYEELADFRNPWSHTTEMPLGVVKLKNDLFSGLVYRACANRPKLDEEHPDRLPDHEKQQLYLWRIINDNLTAAQAEEYLRQNEMTPLTRGRRLARLGERYQGRQSDARQSALAE